MKKINLVIGLLIVSIVLSVLSTIRPFLKPQKSNADNRNCEAILQSYEWDEFDDAIENYYVCQNTGSMTPWDDNIRNDLALK